MLDALEALLALVDQFVQDTLALYWFRVPDPGGVPESDFFGLKQIADGFLPRVDEHVREVSPATVKRTLSGVERVWRAIESGVFYSAPSTVACSGCGYKAVCRAWAG